MDLTSSENIILRYIITNSLYTETCRSEYFKNRGFQELLNVAKKFWAKYNECPTSEQMKETIKLEGKESLVTNGEIDAVYNVDLSKYQDDWKIETTELFIEYKNLIASATDGVKYIQTTPVTTDNIKDVVQTFKNIIIERNSIDFGFEMGLDFFDPESHKQFTHLTFPSGYPFIDLALGGGFSAKSLYVFMGMPKVGKCFLGHVKGRNKRTGKIYNIKIEDLYEKIKAEQSDV